MKKKLTFAAIAAMTSFSLIAVIFSSIAWFNTKTTIDNTSQLDHLGGESDGAYFGGGDGTTSSSAYIISTPRHLYNLAWLQYLGWFNGNDNGATQGNSNATLPTVYFKVTADLDMTGWTLPPIGTTQYPFIGNFNGQGHVISNLATINSANINHYNKVPTPVRSANTVTNVNIVGFFGVVGEINNNIPAAYSTAANQVYNFKLNTYTAKSYTANTLIGMAAGYVNGTLSNVGITGTSDVDVSNQTTSNYSYTYGTGQSAVTKTFTNISNYGVVGYAEAAYKKTIEKTVTNNYSPVFTQDKEGFTAQSGGTNTGWGGSMNMMAAYDGVLEIWNKADYKMLFTYDSNNVAHYFTINGTNLGVTTDPNSAGLWRMNTPSSNSSNTYPYFMDGSTERYIYASNSTTITSSTSYTYRIQTPASQNEMTGFRMYNGSNYIMYSATNNRWESTSSSSNASMFYMIPREASNYDGIYEDSTNNTYTKIDKGFYYYNNTRDILKNSSGGTISDTRGYTDPYYWESKNTSNYHTSNYFLYSNSVQDEDELNYSSYTFQYRDGTNSYLYLYGDERLTKSNGLSTRTSQYENVTVDGAAFKLCFTDPSSSTKYYMNRDGGEINTVTSSTNACVWYENNGYIYTVDNNTSPSATRYYVRYNSGIADLVSTTSTSVPSGATQFDWDSTREMYYYEDDSSWWSTTDYYLYYNVSNSAWQFTESYTYEDTSEAYYLIMGSSGSNYMQANGFSGIYSAGTTLANATHWSREQVGSDYYYYIASGSTKYYLSRSGTTAILSTSRTDAFHTTASATTSASQTKLNSTGNYKIRYNNGAWNIRTNNNTNIYHQMAGVVNRNIPVTCEDEPSKTYQEKHLKTTTTSNTTIQSKPTYFPLIQQTTNDIPNGIPDEANTGYFVGSGTQKQGDMRISKYSLSDLDEYTKAANGDVTLDNVYTINGSGEVAITSAMAATDNFSRYATAKSALEDVLTEDGSYIYGLHFMESEIQYGVHDGVDRSVYAEHAMVNGEEHFNYELPRACIDFNLKEKGFINFMAGAYFPNNNCFFTINKVSRNSSHQITGIKNIREVWSDGVATHGIIYKFDDNSYSVPYQIINGVKKNWAGNADYTESTSSNAPSTYTSTVNNVSTSYSKVFDCSWIDTQKTLKYDSSNGGCAYFFQIPMNDGEYCMGSPSFSGAAGAYLMYLDIGANAKKIYRTTVYEVITMIEEEFELPKGVGIIVSGGTVSDMNSYCVTIESSYNGKVTFNRTSSSAATYTESVASTKVYLSYKHDDLAVNTDEVAEPLSKKETTYERITFYDFAPNAAATTKTILTRKTVVTNGDTQHAQVTYSREQWSGYTNTSAGTVVPDNKVFIYDSEGYDITASYTSALDFDILEAGTCGAVIYTVRNIYTPEGALTITFVLTTSSTVTDTYTIYTVTGYNISITLTKADGVPQEVTVTDECTVTYDNHGTYTITINGQTYTVNVPQTITVSS